MADRVLANEAGVIVETYGEGALVRDLDRMLPEMARWGRDAGLHGAVGDLASELRRCRHDDDLQGAERVCHFVEHVLTQPKRLASEMPNAVAISFIALKELDESQRSWIRTTAPSVWAVLDAQERIDNAG